MYAACMFSIHRITRWRHREWWLIRLGLGLIPLWSPRNIKLVQILFLLVHNCFFFVINVGNNLFLSFIKIQNKKIICIYNFVYFSHLHLIRSKNFISIIQVFLRSCSLGITDRLKIEQFSEFPNMEEKNITPRFAKKPFV